MRKFWITAVLVGAFVLGFAGMRLMGTTRANGTSIRYTDVKATEVTPEPEPGPVDAEPQEKPKDIEGVKAAIMKFLHEACAEGEYHIEVSWDRVNGGIVKLVLIPKAEWEAQQKADEDGSGYTPKGEEPKRRD